MQAIVDMLQVSQWYGKHAKVSGLRICLLQELNFCPVEWGNGLTQLTLSTCSQIPEDQQGNTHEVANPW